MITFPQHKFLPPLSPLLITHSNIRTWLILAAMLPYAGAENANFLESCTLCSKPLGHNSDIFMYRGNNPFCSQECRQEQIEIDEAREKRWKKSKKTTTKTNVRTGTAVTA